MSETPEITAQAIVDSFAAFCAVLAVSLRASFRLPGQDTPPTDLLLDRMELEISRLPPEQIGEARKLLEILRRTLRSPRLQLLDPPDGRPN